MKYEDLTEQDWVLFRAMLLLTETRDPQALGSSEFVRLCMWLQSRLGMATLARMRGELRVSRELFKDKGNLVGQYQNKSNEMYAYHVKCNLARM